MDRVVEQLYLGAVDDDALQRLPQTLREHLGGNTCCLWTFEGRTGRPHGRFVTDQPDDMIGEYVAHYHGLDPWREPVLRLPGRAVLGDELIRGADLERTEYYNDFSRRLGMFHLLAATAPVGESGLLVALTTHRGRNEDAFAPAALARLDGLLPHVLRSAQMRLLFDRAQRDRDAEAIQSMLAVIPTPALLCDGSGRVLFANPAAAQAGCPPGGLSIAGRPGELAIRLPEAKATHRLLALVANAALGGPGGTLPVGPAFVTAAPLPPAFARFGVQAGTALVTVQRFDAASAAARVMATFALTPAEAGTAAALASGLSPEMAAEQRGVALGTVRTLLRRAMAKTGTDNLRQLVALLVRLPP